MRVSGKVKDAKKETPLPDAKINLYIEERELAEFYSNSDGEFEHKESASYIGKTLTCHVYKEGFQNQKVTHKIEQDEVLLEIELVPEEEEEEHPVVPPPTPRRKWPIIVISAAIVVAIAAVVIVLVMIYRDKTPNVGNERENEPPLVKFQIPKHGDVFRIKQITVVVSVKDEDGIEWVKINGKNASYNSDQESAKIAIQLEGEGWTRIIAEASDDSKKHKRNSEEVFVRYLPPLVIPPIVLEEINSLYPVMEKPIRIEELNKIIDRKQDEISNKIRESNEFERPRLQIEKNKLEALREELKIKN